MAEAASVIGNVIGKPELQYRQITYDPFRGILLQMGIAKHSGPVRGDVGGA